MSTIPLSEKDQLDLTALDAAPSPDVFLTMHDRCDRCGAQAKVRFVFMTGDLLFCGHHGREYTPAIVGVGILTTDTTSRS